MKDAFRAEFRIFVVALLTLMAIVLCLPGHAIEPTDGGDQTSSRRKPNATSPSSESSSTSKDDKGKSDKDSEAKPKNTDQPTTKSDVTSERKSDKSASPSNAATTPKSSSAAPSKEPMKRPNALRDDPPPKLKSDGKETELSIEAQQKKDQGECPGSEASKEKTPASQNLNDIPLDQDEHPFDAPAAESDEENTASSENKKPALPLRRFSVRNNSNYSSESTFAWHTTSPTKRT